MEKDSLNCEDGVCEVSNVEEVNMMNQENVGEDRNKLLYFGDPMCSWCWGITNHLEQIVEYAKDTTDFELVLGGLRPGGGDEWNDETKEMIKSHWGHVHDASGQPFDYRFFDKETFNYDTEPPSRAVRVVRDIAPTKEWSFYKSLQKAFYAENRDIHDLNVLQDICATHGIDYAIFEPKFLSQEYKQLVYKDFARSQQLGVRGFPAVVLVKNGEYIAVSMGYSNYETMKSRIDQILAN